MFVQISCFSKSLITGSVYTETEFSEFVTALKAAGQNLKQCVDFESPIREIII